MKDGKAVFCVCCLLLFVPGFSRVQASLPTQLKIPKKAGDGVVVYGNEWFNDATGKVEFTLELQPDPDVPWRGCAYELHPDLRDLSDHPDTYGGNTAPPDWFNFQTWLEPASWWQPAEFSMLERVRFADGIINVPRYLFDGLGSIRNVDFSGCIKIIQSHAFQNCTEIREIYLPGHVETVWNYAFLGCVHLKKVTFNAGVDHIQECVFKWCIGLDDIIINSEHVPGLNPRAFEECHHAITFHVPVSMLQAYHNADVWKDNITNPHLVHRFVSIEDGLTLDEYRAREEAEREEAERRAREAVAGVGLNRTALILGVRGSTGQLTATVSPATAVNKNVTWNSNNPAVATVSSTGLITAIARGTATVTATTADGGFGAPCAVTVTGNSDATLRSLTVASAAGTNVTLTLNSGTATYTGSVSGSVSGITITATKNDTYAAVTGDGQKTLAAMGSDNSFPITVTAENGTMRTYAVNIRRKSSDATLQSLAVSNGTLSPAFAPGTVTYYDTVPNSLNSIAITAEKNYLPADVTGTGVKSLDVGDNHFDITVTAEDGTKKVYTVSVHKLSNDATLRSLAVSNVTLSPPFNPGTAVYSDTVPNSVNSIAITAEKNHLLADVTGTGVKSLNVDDNTFNITVTAEDGTQKGYTINIHKLSNDATLETLTGTGKLSPAFVPGTVTYYDTVPCTAGSIEVTATKHHIRASEPLIEGKDGLTPGNNLVTVTVTAEDGTPKVYTINVYKLSNDATLSLLGVDNDYLTPAFAPDRTAYYDTVPCSVEDITITAVKNYSLAGITGTWPAEMAEYSLHLAEAADTAVIFTVTSEDRTATNTYTVFVHRLSNDSTLKFLGVNKGTLSPLFAGDRFHYTDTVPHSVNSITIEAEMNYILVKDREVTGTGEKRLNVGDTTFTVVGTAEDGTKGTYTVSVHRLSNDSTLKRLTVNGREVRLYPRIFNYRVEVEVADIIIDCEASYPAATVLNAGAYPVNYGDNDFTVTVNAEDFETQGTTKTYTITVYRINNDATLKYLVTAPAELVPPFNPDITQYTANVPYQVSSVMMDFEVNYPRAELWTAVELEQPGIKHLNVGENVFGIGVFSETKKYYRAYWVKITREAPPVINPPTGFDYRYRQLKLTASGGIIEIDTPVTERICIYSVAGTLLYSFDKPAGAFTLHFYPSPVLIVKGSSGWTRKIVNNP